MAATTQPDILARFAPSLRVEELKLYEIRGDQVTSGDIGDDGDGDTLWTDHDKRICLIFSLFRKYYQSIQPPEKVINKLIETIPEEFQIISKHLPTAPINQFQIMIIVADFYSVTCRANSNLASRNCAAQKLHCKFKRLNNLVENFEQIASNIQFPVCMEQFISNNRKMVKITCEKILNKKYQCRIDIWHLRRFFAVESDAMTAMLKAAHTACRFLQHFSNELDALNEVDIKQQKKQKPK